MARPNQGAAGAKLTTEQVLRMRLLALEKRPTPLIARMFGVSLPTAQCAITGRTYAHVPGPVPLKRRDGRDPSNLWGA